MVLLAYDGADPARRAIITAGRLLHGRAVVAHVIEPAAPAPVLGPAGVPVVVPDMTAQLQADAEQRERRARELMTEGCRLAADAGLDAPEPLLLHGGGAHGVSEALLSAAEEHDASVIVVGRRGLGALKATVLGSVSDELVRHARRPVLVVTPES